MVPWAAVAAGFSGVLIVLRPGLDVVQSSTLIVLVAVLLYALYQVLRHWVLPGRGGEFSFGSDHGPSCDQTGTPS
jgi:hypothetical protein